MPKQETAIIPKATSSEGENMPDIQTLTSTVQGLESSVNRWNSVALWFIFATAIVAIGYFVVSYVASKKASQLKTAQDNLLRAKDEQLVFDLKEKDVQIAEANAKAEDARKGTETAKTEAAKANAEAAKANEKAESERLARLKIEERLAPRFLTTEQQNELSEKLKKFAGQNLDIFAFGDTPEIIRITYLVNSALISAGWITRAWTVTAGPTVSEIIVLLRKESAPDTSDAAIALANELLNHKFATKLIIVTDDKFPAGNLYGRSTPDKIAPIRLYIGAKE